MFREIYAAASDEASSITARIVRLVVGAIVGAAAVIALFVAASRALFVWVDWYHGPLAGHLAVAAVWLLVAVVALAIAFAGRRKPRRRITTAAHDARVQAFDSARSVGESISDTITGRTGPLHSRRGLANSVLGALVIGMLIGRRF